MWFRKKHPRGMIDLLKYEKDLLYQREHAIDLRPPPFPLDLPVKLTDSEQQATRDNREAARQIYERIKATL